MVRIEAEVISFDKKEQAASAGALYSQAIRVRPFVFVAGQQGEDPTTGKFTKDLEKEIEQAFENVNRALTEAGTSWANVVKTTYFLKDPSIWEVFKKVRRKVFEKYGVKKYPASTAVACNVLGEGHIEVEAIAIVPERSPQKDE